MQSVHKYNWFYNLLFYVNNAIKKSHKIDLTDKVNKWPRTKVKNFSHKINVCHWVIVSLIFLERGS